MNCAEARDLLDANITPGPGDPTRARLGFHLSGCVACRSYQRRDAGLLADLLADLPAPPVVPAPPAPRRPRRAALAGAALLLGLAALLTVTIGPAVLALISIRSDLAAISVAAPARTVLPRPSATVAPAVPTGAAPAVAAARQPSATALPTATAPVARPSPTAASSAAPAAVAVEQRAPLGAEPPDRPTPRPSAAPPAPAPLLLPTIIAPERFLNFVAADPAAPPLNIGALPDLGSEAISLLLLGFDRRPNEGGPSRSDAIAVVVIDLARGRAAMLSLPRDLVVAIPEVGYARINTAYVYGELDPQLGGGRELARRTVQDLLGLPINYVVEADFMGFIAAVDALGGVTIDVPQPLYDPAYPTMDYGYQAVSFAAGPQQMDGARALIYGRTRHVDSDFGRMLRQQALIVALIEQVRGQNMLDQIQSVASVTGALRGFVRTDMPEEQMIGLAWALRGLDPAAVTRLTLTRGQVASNVLPEDPYALFAQPGAIEGLVAQLLGR